MWDEILKQLIASGMDEKEAIALIKQNQAGMSATASNPNPLGGTTPTLDFSGTKFWERNPVYSQPGGTYTTPPVTPTVPNFTPNFQDPSKFFDPALIQALYASARGNLSRTAGGQVAGAQRTMGAQAGARNLLNPTAAILGAGSQVRGQYAPVFGNLETQQAGALQENQQNLYKALLSREQMQEQARQFGVSSDLQRQAMENQYNLGIKGLALQKSAQTPSIWGILGGIGSGLAGLLSGGSTSALAGLFPSIYKKKDTGSTSNNSWYGG